MTDLELDVTTWFTERQLQYKPNHFIMAQTPLTKESHLWIYSTLKGRFCLCTSSDIDNDFFDSHTQFFPAFENPHEATFYELTWS